MYKTWNIYKFTFYMKLMTASCSMSNFLPIVIIFRQITVSEFHFYMIIPFNMFMSFNMLNMLHLLNMYYLQIFHVVTFSSLFTFP